MSGDKFNQFIQANRNDRADTIKWFLPYDDWKLMNQEQWNIWVDLSKATRVFSTRSDIPKFQQKYSISGQYSVISNKDSNNPKFQHQDNHNDQDEDDNDTFQYSKCKYEYTRRVKLDIF